MKKQPLPRPNKKKVVRDLEQERLLTLTHYEQEVRSQGFRTIAGVDEAGRGPLAGPVVAAACIIPDGLYFRYINDSKQLPAELREVLYSDIISHADVRYGVGIICQKEIDRVNIYQATILAMQQAVAALSTCPDYLLVDGLKLPHPTIPCMKLIQGDALSQSIAAASIIAKVTRDRLMAEYHEEWPQYGFKSHKGYGTPQHLTALREHGPCPLHRFSFEPVKAFNPVATALEFNF